MTAEAARTAAQLKARPADVSALAESLLWLAAMRSHGIETDTRAGIGSGVRRIMIVGQPGSGKSTLAQALGEATGLPVIHIDKIHWQPGWVERSKAEKTRLCIDAEQCDRWIFEGGHSSTWRSRLARADMLIWLDRPLRLRIWRVLRRAMVGLGHTRPDMAEGCPERLRSLPEFVTYMWRTRKSGVAKIEALVRHAHSGCEVIHLRSEQDARDFVAKFGSR